MISIIICSRKKQLSSEFIKNIEQTIGCNFEFIVIDNSTNKYSIFEAYSIGIKKSIGNYLCFMHDDIFIHSNNWGVSIDEIYKNDSKIGLIGIAGCKIKSKMPSAWWDAPKNEHVVHIIQHYKSKPTQKLDIGFKESSCIEVAAIDGVFMVMKKQNNICFNNKLNGFHNYDLNASFEHIKKGLKIVVTNKILLEHFSIGQLDKTWYKSVFKIHQLYSDVLPINKNNFPQESNTLELKNGINFIYNAFHLKQFNIAFKSWVKFFFVYPFSIYHFKLIKKIVLK